MTIAKELIDLGVSPNHKMERYGSTPVQWAVYCGIKNASGLNQKQFEDV